MALLGTWRSLYTLRYVPITLVQVVFSVATVYILSAAQAVSGPRMAWVPLKHSLAQLELCIQYLAEIGKSWGCGHHVGGILANLIQEQLTPRLKLWAISGGHEGQSAAPTAPGSAELVVPAGPSTSLSHSHTFGSMHFPSSLTHGGHDPRSEIELYLNHTWAPDFLLSTGMTAAPAQKDFDFSCSDAFLDSAAADLPMSDLGSGHAASQPFAAPSASFGGAEAEMYSCAAGDSVEQNFASLGFEGVDGNAMSAELTLSNGDMDFVDLFLKRCGGI
jgi:hypothetical protein